MVGDRIEELLDGKVPLRLNEGDGDRLATDGCCRRSEVRHHFVFDAFAEGTAAEEKLLDLRHVSLLPEDDHTDVAVITKPVRNVENQRRPSTRSQLLPQLRFTGLHAGRIKLVRPPDQLCDPRDMIIGCPGGSDV